MKIRTRKQNSDGIVRLETSGVLKEVMINEDFLKPNQATIALCFKGKNSSGIVEITPKELEILNKEVSPRLNLVKDVKVMKFRK